MVVVAPTCKLTIQAQATHVQLAGAQHCKLACGRSGLTIYIFTPALHLIIDINRARVPLTRGQAREAALRYVKLPEVVVAPALQRRGLINGTGVCIPSTNSSPALSQIHSHSRIAVRIRIRIRICICIGVCVCVCVCICIGVCICVSICGHTAVLLISLKAVGARRLLLITARTAHKQRYDWKNEPRQDVLHDC
jgi:hypothetical protein